MQLKRRHTAIDQNILTQHIRRFITGQKHRGVRDLIRISKPILGHFGQQLARPLLHCLRRQSQLSVDGRFDQTGADGVDPNITATPHPTADRDYMFARFQDIPNLITYPSKANFLFSKLPEEISGK